MPFLLTESALFPDCFGEGDGITALDIRDKYDSVGKTYEKDMDKVC
jgi:hypothetical protein